MFSVKTLVSQYPQTPRKPLVNPFEFVRNPNGANAIGILKCWLISLTTKRPISVLAQSEISTSQDSQKTTRNENSKHKNKRPLDVLFKEALGLRKREINESEIEVDGGDDAELKKKLWDLEMELRQLKAKSEEQGSRLNQKLDGKVEDGSKPKPTSLHAVFVGENGGREKCFESNHVLVLKEISVDMQVLLRHLYDRGYFTGVNFLLENRFDISYFDNKYARDFLKSAVERFGKDNQEISAWLSGSDLKAIALFGCPSKRKREVFAAKRLRTFFRIPEETVCSSCSLKRSCKFVNQRAWNDDTKNLRLDLLMRLLSAYSLEDISAELKLTDNVKTCVSRLIHDIVSLTKSSV